MNRLRKAFLLLQPRNGIAVIELLILLVLISFRINRYPLPSLLRILDRKGEKNGHLGTEDRKRAQLYWELLSFLLAQCMKVKRPCLFRSLVLFSYYRRKGIDIHVAYGIRKDCGHFDGHSWLVFEESPFLEKTDPSESFAVLYVYP
ncbi:MAG: hypothetical protein B6I30_05530 [Desulfobacteraceae bacterium 4572_187]|nr:MAG: hypothetical protein B6I30_05530 [Desulfobacteraceae bacterium 4572_187]